MHYRSTSGPNRWFDIRSHHHRSCGGEEFTHALPLHVWPNEIVLCPFASYVLLSREEFTHALPLHLWANEFVLRPFAL